MKTDYDSQAERWARDEPLTLSDFVASAAVFDMCRDRIEGKVVLDLGCGEGYFARQVARIAKGWKTRVIAVDSSPEMIRVALRQTTSVEYYVRDAANVDIVPDSYVDLCVGNFIAHYFAPDKLPALYSEISRVLNEKGEFIITIPHPCFQLLGQPTTATHDKEGYHYINSRGRFFNGKIPTIDGKTLEIGLCHSTIEDHFNAMQPAGLAVTSIKEPPVPKELADKYELFRGLEGNVGFMIMAGRKLVG